MPNNSATPSHDSRREKYLKEEYPVLDNTEFLQAFSELGDGQGLLQFLDLVTTDNLQEALSRLSQREYSNKNLTGFRDFAVRYLMAVYANKKNIILDEHEGFTQLKLLINNIDFQTNPEEYINEVKELMRYASTVMNDNEAVGMIAHVFVKHLKLLFILSVIAIPIIAATLGIMVAAACPPLTAALLAAPMYLVVVGTILTCVSASFSTLTLSQWVLGESKKTFTEGYRDGQTKCELTRPEILYGASQGWFFKSYTTPNMRNEEAVEKAAERFMAQ